MKSSVGRKVLMALTGILLSAFLVAHLLANLLLLLNDPGPFNRYSHTLVSLGWPLIIVELALLALFVVHFWTAITVTLENRRARPGKYQQIRSAGPPSRKSVASSAMIWTGLILLVFTAFHVYTFKYGPGIEEGYVAELGGEQIRDLHRLVVEVFSNPIYVFGYMGVMVFLGLHLRHGFWSAFQSLGVSHPRYTRLIFAVGYAIAVILGLGFLVIPLWVYLFG